MLLHSVEIKNYRSLEHVKLENLQHFNVLIGRNNAGKSSVFLALEQLGRVFQGNAFPPEVLTDRDLTLSLEIYLTFKPTNHEREKLINLLIADGLNDVDRERILQSPFFRMIRFSARSAMGRPDLMHLRETELLAQDGTWAVIHR